MNGEAELRMMEILRRSCLMWPAVGRCLRLKERGDGLGCCGCSVEGRSDDHCELQEWTHDLADRETLARLKLVVVVVD